VCPRKAAVRQFPLQAFAEMANAVLNKETGELGQQKKGDCPRKHYAGMHHKNEQPEWLMLKTSILC